MKFHSLKSIEYFFFVVRFIFFYVILFAPYEQHMTLYPTMRISYYVFSAIIISYVLDIFETRLISIFQKEESKGI